MLRDGSANAVFNLDEYRSVTIDPAEMPLLLISMNEYQLGDSRSLA
jgi:hypothetical protein